MPDRHDSQIRELVASLAGSAPPAPAFREILARLPSEAGRPHGLPGYTALDPSRPDGEPVDPAPPYVNGDHRHRPWRLMAALVAFCLATAGGIFAYGSLNGDDGSSTPKKAVEHLVRAFGHADLLGMLESVEPSERATLRNSLGAIERHTARLGVTKGADLGDVSGLSFEVSDLELAATPLSPDIVSVEVHGRLRSRVDQRELPIGDVVRRFVPGAQSDISPRGTVAHLNEAINRSGVHLIAVREAGKWHVSVLYTLAEYIRKLNGLPQPDFGRRDIAPVGASNPEAVLRALFDAAGDPAALVALTDPLEGRVLYDYGPMLDRQYDPQGQVAVGHLGMRVDGTGDRRIVHLVTYDLTWSHPPLTDEAGPAGADRTITDHLTLDGRCYTATQTTTGPGGAAPQTSPPDKTCEVDTRTNPRAAVQWQHLASTQVSVVRRDGRWFVSPARTFLDQAATRLSLVPDGRTISALGRQGELERSAFDLLSGQLVNIIGGAPVTF